MCIEAASDADAALYPTASENKFQNHCGCVRIALWGQAAIALRPSKEEDLTHLTVQQHIVEANGRRTLRHPLLKATIP